MALTILDVKSGNNSVNASSMSLPSTAAPPNACLVVVAMASIGGGTHNAPTDNFSNTYTQIGSTLSVTSGSTVELSLWRCDGATANGSTALTVTLHSSVSTQMAGVVWVASGQNASSYNGDTVGQTGSSANPHSGTSTPAPAGASLFIGGMTSFNPNTATVGTGWNTVGVNGFTSAMASAALLPDNAVGQSIFTEYQIASVAEDATWTMSSDTWLADVASFRQAGAGTVAVVRVPCQTVSFQQRM